MEGDDLCWRVEEDGCSFSSLAEEGRERAEAEEEEKSTTRRGGPAKPVRLAEPLDRGRTGRTRDAGERSAMAEAETETDAWRT